jgi:hypothetical protein
MDKHSKVVLWKVAGVSKTPVSTSEGHFAGVAGVHSNTHVYAGARGNMESRNETPATPADNPMDSDYQNPKHPQTPAPTMSKIDRPTPSRSRHICRSCGQHFEVPLMIASMGGYICEPCRRDGPPAAPQAPDRQTKLDGSEAKAA